MRTAASEHLNNEQMMSRLSATFSALIREEVDLVRRFLDSESPELEGHEMGPIVELSVRLVERSAEWLDVGTVASLARELRESLLQLGSLRPAQRQELISHCRVALDTQEKLADQLRTDGFAALLEHAASVGDAVDQLRARLGRAKTEALNASRGVIDDVTPDMEPRENLLALTFEIKSSLVHQNDRISSISDGLGASLRSMQTALTEWDGLMKAIDPARGGASPAEAAPPAGRRKASAGPTVAARAIQIHQKLEEVAAGMRTLVHDLHQLLGIQHSLERRARDLDEHLLWEFLDPLERFIDEFYAATSRRDTEERRSVLTVHTGGVGFEPEIGAILLPLLFRLLETAASPEGEPTRDLRLTAAREGLEARIALEGRVRFEPDALQQLESGLEELGGFVTLQEGKDETSRLHLQFPMARSLRGFLIVEAAGQRVALPWSAIDRICSSADELTWSGGTDKPDVVPLASLFTPADGSEPAPPRRGAEGAKPSNGPLAVLKCGGCTGAIGFDRIVWRENARLTPLPPRLYPVEEVFGGIIGSDGQVTLVLHPASVMRRLRGAAFGGSEAPAGKGGVAE
ncbi:MAG TPA: hypothetical protein VFU59_05075 [Candidatus Eisenbacteria bacterium]|nr:hypothetical protein [Candidatus Eisenbacteria bacterium]